MEAAASEFYVSLYMEFRSEDKIQDVATATVNSHLLKVIKVLNDIESFQGA